MIYDREKSVNFNCPVYWGVEDREKFEYHIGELSKLVDATHFADNMFVWQRSNSMVRDERFLEIWQRNIVSESDKAIIWRRYILATLAYNASHLDGDFVECGAYEGVAAKIIREYVAENFVGKKYWLYDLFEHREGDLNHPMPHHGENLYEDVLKRFADFSDVEVLQGEIPTVFEKGIPNKIAFLHVDLNQAPAEIAVLDSLFERVVKGGVIVFDDYEYFYYRAQKYAEDEWFAKRGYRISPLPTSQGILIKS